MIYQITTNRHIPLTGGFTYGMLRLRIYQVAPTTKLRLLTLEYHPEPYRNDCINIRLHWQLPSPRYGSCAAHKLAQGTLDIKFDPDRGISLNAEMSAALFFKRVCILTLVERLRERVFDDVCYLINKHYNRRITLEQLLIPSAELSRWDFWISEVMREYYQGRLGLDIMPTKHVA